MPKNTIYACNPINKTAAIVVGQTGCRDTEMSKTEVLERIKCLLVRYRIIEKELGIKNYSQRKNFKFACAHKRCSGKRFKNKTLINEYILTGRQMQKFHRRLEAIKKNKKETHYKCLKIK